MLTSLALLSGLVGFPGWPPPLSMPKNAFRMEGPEIVILPSVVDVGVVESNTSVQFDVRLENHSFHAVQLARLGVTYYVGIPEGYVGYELQPGAGLDIHLSLRAPLYTTDVYSEFYVVVEGERHYTAPFQMSTFGSFYFAADEQHSLLPAGVVCRVPLGSSTNVLVAAPTRPGAQIIGFLIYSPAPWLLIGINDNTVTFQVDREAIPPEQVDERGIAGALLYLYTNDAGFHWIECRVSVKVYESRDVVCEMCYHGQCDTCACGVCTEDGCHWLLGAGFNCNVACGPAQSNYKCQGTCWNQCNGWCLDACSVNGVRLCGCPAGVP